MSCKPCFTPSSFKGASYQPHVGQILVKTWHGGLVYGGQAYSMTSETIQNYLLSSQFNTGKLGQMALNLESRALEIVLIDPHASSVPGYQNEHTIG
jgi:hypothetical protein